MTALVPFLVVGIAEDDTIGSGKNIVAGASLNIIKLGGGAASIYLDEAGTTPISLPTTLDSSGQKMIFIAAGAYDVIIGGVSRRQDIIGLASSPVKVSSFAVLATTPAPVAGMTAYVVGSGAGLFIDTTTSGVDDGGTKINNTLTSGRMWQRVDTMHPSVAWWGVVGSGDETTKVQSIEASAFDNIDLCGMTVTTTLDSDGVSKKYFNGTLIVDSTEDNPLIYKNSSSLRPEELDISGSTKSKVLDWGGKKVLWLGTSIPAEGGLGIYDPNSVINGSSYPMLFGESLGCYVNNMAWARSHAHFDVSADPFPAVLYPVNALSMTQDDLTVLLAAHGASSIYSDSIDPITKPSEMTADYRIKAPFASTPFDVVMLDHSHNDQYRDCGTLTPESLTVSGITKGATTAITLASSGTIAVGDAVYLDIVGIDKLKYAAGRVQTKVGNVITLSVDSSGYTGAFSSGSLIKVDRFTIYGAWDFLISYIKNMSYVYGDGAVDIVLSGAPSEHTNNVPSPSIYSNARYIKNVADKWGIAFFDFAAELKIQAGDHQIYLPDNVHPTTLPTRRYFAAVWADWAVGGRRLITNDKFFLKSAYPSAANTDQLPAKYSRYTDGFSTTLRKVKDPIAQISDNFSGGVGAWTLTGTVTGVAAPWNASLFAAKCAVTAGSSSYLYRTFTGQDAIDLQFSLQISDDTISSGVGVVQILELGAAGGAHYSLDLVCTSGGISTLRLVYYTGAGTGYTPLSGYTIALTQGVKHSIRFEAIKQTATDYGAMLVYFNDLVIPLAYDQIANDLANNVVDRLSIGVKYNSTTSPFDLYISDVVVKTRKVINLTSDWTSWTPTVTALSGSYTLASATGKYFRDEYGIHGFAEIGVTTVGTGSGPLKFSLPATSDSDTIGQGTGWNTGTGACLFVRIDNSATDALVVTTGGTNPIPSGGTLLRVSFFYKC